MIYITGDIHADPRRFSTDGFPEQKSMTKNDYVIICGDFGLLWDQPQSSREKHAIDWLSQKPFTTLFVDGNHENFDRLNALPVEEWHGGKVHRISDSIFHLIRGEMFDLDGISVFAFGGARSHDIKGLATDAELAKDYTAGILRKSDPYYLGKKKLLHRYDCITPYREEGKSWWKQEMPSWEEMEHGLETLKAHGMKTNFIITHDGPASDVAILGGGSFQQDPLTKYLEGIKQAVDYDCWFFGHHHMDRRVDSKDFVFFEQISRIA